MILCESKAKAVYFCIGCYIIKKWTKVYITNHKFVYSSCPPVCFHYDIICFNIIQLVWVHRKNGDPDYQMNVILRPLNPIWCYAGITANWSNRVIKGKTFASVNNKKNALYGLFTSLNKIQKSKSDKETNKHNLFPFVI